MTDAHTDLHDGKWISLILLLILAIFFIPSGDLHAAQDSEQTAAVLSFKVAPEMEKETGDALANIVRHEVLQSGRLTLIDRDRTEAVLQEQGFMMAGGCYDVSCLVEMGKVLGAERVITGSVNKIGRKYIIELRAANVGTGAIEALETREFTGPVEGITESVRSLATSLVNVLTRQKGTLRITTDPPASAVIVDGTPVGFAPVELERPGGITYELEAQRSGYERATKRVLLPEADTLHVRLELDRIRSRRRSYRVPQLRFFASGGFPLEQRTSNFSADLTWGTGESYGGSIQYGTGWRLGFGGYLWKGTIRGLEDRIWQDYGSSEQPHGEARVFYSDLILSLGNSGFAPFVGAGLTAMERTVSTTLTSGVKESYKTDQEIGWMVTMGAEIPIHKFITTQIGVIFSKSLADDQSWWRPQDTTASPNEFWISSFDQFASFTALHFSVGFRI